MRKGTAASLALTLALLCPTLGTAAVYRCTVDGAITFSDRPCSNDAVTVEVEAPPASGMRLDTGTQVEFYRPETRERRQDTGPCRHINSTELNTLVVRKQIVRGMTEADVRRSWGSPSSVFSGRRTQWAYHWSDFSTSYVYFENGCVTSFSGYSR